MRFNILILPIALLLQASVAGPAMAQAPMVRVRAAWIRWLPAGLPAAGYLTLTNTGGKTIELEAASSPAYGDVSIHRSITRGTTEEMVPVTAIKLEPRQTLVFETTGYHFMLSRPNASADAAATIPITLEFAGGSSLTVPFEVRRNAAASPTAASPAAPR